MINIFFWHVHSNIDNKVQVYLMTSLAFYEISRLILSITVFRKSYYGKNIKKGMEKN